MQCFVHRLTKREHIKQALLAWYEARNILVWDFIVTVSLLYGT